MQIYFVAQFRFYKKVTMLLQCTNWIKNPHYHYYAVVNTKDIKTQCSKIFVAASKWNDNSSTNSGPEVEVSNKALVLQARGTSSFLRPQCTCQLEVKTCSSARMAHEEPFVSIIIAKSQAWLVIIGIWNVCIVRLRPNWK